MSKISFWFSVKRKDMRLQQSFFADQYKLKVLNNS